MNIKKTIFFAAVLFFGTQLSFFSQSKAISIPSDAPNGFTYDFAKAQNLIIERLSAPDASNAEAEAIITANDFPKLDRNKKIDSEYKDKLRVWMEKNPNLIISSFKNRKEIVQAY